jgi:flavin-dependent thymidylate synthase
MSKELSRWADAAMFRSEPMPAEAQNGPVVTLLNATPDPLGSLAALWHIYTGRVVRSLAEVSDDDRRTAFADVMKNPLQGPLESVQFHFLVEGVTRAFTHQMVRGRHAFYAQESLRFAVPEEDFSARVAYPPSLAWDPKPYNPEEFTNGYGSEADHQYAIARTAWDMAVEQAEESYHALVDAGIPAEDARGLLPHAITTRLHWVCSLRELLYVAGLRLCTQAQFEWRLAMASAVKALREHSSDSLGVDPGTDHRDAWQFELIADRLRPICYQTGKCAFKAAADRPCAIRERVDANEQAGRPPSEWGQPNFARNNPGQKYGSQGEAWIGPIQPAEWLADPNAARKGR